VNPLLLVFLLECVLGSPGDADDIHTAACALSWAFGVEQAQDNVADAVLPPEPASKRPRSYTLMISRFRGGAVEFTGTGYDPPEDLGTYQICVHGEREYSTTVSEDREVVQTTPWTECRFIGLVSSDGTVRFSQWIKPGTTSVCVVLMRSFSAKTSRVPGSRSGIGVPVVAWPDRYESLACVEVRR
jgi:hypothetical protein